jgi:hypothetical protein
MTVGPEKLKAQNVKLQAHKYVVFERLESGDEILVRARFIMPEPKPTSPTAEPT